jgi:putative ABC transport system permease protein
LKQLRNVPGVESAAAVDSLPMTGSTEGVAYYPVGTFNKKPGEEPIARASTVTPDYFKTMGISLRGRDFGSTDGEQSHLVIISEAVARINWPNENPIGKIIGIRGAGSRSWEVIGVVPEIKDDGLSAAAPPRLYFNQQEFGEKAMTVVVRASGDLKGMIPNLRREVGALDPTLPIYNFQTVEDLVNSSLARNRVVTRIISAFSMMALILAAVGVYGVILSTLVRRTWEFGLRIALGSTLGRIAWLVWREGLLLVGIGIAAGLVIAFASSRLVSSLLFGITAVDFPSYLIAGAAQLLVVAGGSLVLLRRIARLDPASALKNR